MSTLTQYTNRDTGHERKIGRYWISDIWAIRKGYLTVGGFFKSKPIDEQGAMNIETGNCFEQKMEEVLVALNKEHDYNPKKELEIDDFILVVKPDFVFPKCIIETKAPVKITREIPEKWKDQLCGEAKAFGKPVYLGVFGNNPTRRFSMPDLYKYKYEEERWEEIKDLLRTFHQKLIKKYASTKESKKI